MDKDPAIARINEVLRQEKMNREELAKQTGIGYARWGNVIQGKATLRHEEIVAIGKLWPEYKLWLAYGDEMPDAGQISPMTKAAQQELGTQRKAE